MTTLDLARIQGFVVRGYRLPFSRYLFLRVDDAARTAAWVADTTAEVLSAAPWDDKPDSGVNVAFSYSGLSSFVSTRISRRERPDSSECRRLHPGGEGCGGVDTESFFSGHTTIAATSRSIFVFGTSLSSGLSSATR